VNDRGFGDTMRGIVVLAATLSLALAATASPQAPPLDQSAIAAAVEQAKANPEASKAYALIASMEDLALSAEVASSDPLIMNIRTYLAPEGVSQFRIELGQRAARDQFWRKANVREIFAMSGGATEEGRAAFAFLVGDRRTQVDQDNTLWLKAELDRRKAWPGMSELDQQGANNIWLLVQHADRSPGFQKYVLELMTPMVTAGEVLRVNYAYLYDRVAVHDGRPQRYGTQMDCSGPEGGPGPMGGLEDPANVDALRAGMGVAPEKLADQLAQARFCRRQ
jgi:hypothetical protein